MQLADDADTITACTIDRKDRFDAHLVFVRHVDHSGIDLACRDSSKKARKLSQEHRIRCSCERALWVQALGHPEKLAGHGTHGTPPTSTKSCGGYGERLVFDRRFRTRSTAFSRPSVERPSTPSTWLERSRKVDLVSDHPCSRTKSRCKGTRLRIT
jgi:hypothetical protein